MPTDKQPTRVHHLNRLAVLRREREKAAAEYAGAECASVLDARLEGATWAEIGSVLGVSAQAVQKKYHRSPAHTGDCADHDYRDANGMHLCRPNGARA
jgi:DNA-directed RNA polymerase specialized sigma24 family protein